MRATDEGARTVGAAGNRAAVGGETWPGASAERETEGDATEKGATNTPSGGEAAGLGAGPKARKTRSDDNGDTAESIA